MTEDSTLYLKRKLDEHQRGEHFSWSACPYCWAERKIQEEFDRAKKVIA